MSRRFHRTLSIISILALSGGCTTILAEINVEPALSASATVLYESSLVLDESDVTTTTGDVGVNSEWLAGFHADFHQSFELNVQYSRSDIRYRDQQAFDLTTQIVYGSMGYQWQALNIGVDTMVADAKLNQRDYLRITQLSPYWSLAIGRSGFLQGSAGITRRQFSDTPARSSTGPNAALRYYFLFNNLDHYMYVFFRGRVDNAEQSQFDAERHTLGINWHRNNTVLRQDFAWSLQTAFELQNHPRQAPERVERNLEVNGEWQWNFGDHLHLALTCDYLNNQSNQDNFEFEQWRWGLRLGAEI